MGPGCARYDDQHIRNILPLLPSPRVPTFGRSGGVRPPRVAVRESQNAIVLCRRPFPLHARKMSSVPLLPPLELSTGVPWSHSLRGLLEFLSGGRHPVSAAF